MFSYLVPLYQSYGYSVLQISAIATATSFASILSKPLYGILCNRAKQMRFIMLPVFLISCVAALLLHLGNGRILATVISVVLLTATSGAAGGLIDAWEGRLLVEGASINYGLTRACGSFCYAIMATVFGNILDLKGFSAIVPTFLALTIPLAFFVISVSDSGNVTAVPQKEQTNNSGSLSDLLKNKEYLWLLLAGFLFFVAADSISLFFPLRVEEIGGTNADYGFILSIGGISEVVGLLFYRWFSHSISDRRLLQISFLFAVIQHAISAFSPYLWLLKLDMLLQGPYNGLYMAAIVHYIPKLVGAKNSYMANMIYATVLGIAAVTSNISMGIGVDMLGLQPSMIIAVFVAVAALVVFTFSKKQKRVSSF